MTSLVQRAPRRAILVLAAALGVGAAVAAVPASPAAASEQSAIVTATNAERASAGLPALASNPGLDRVAQDWAQYMSDTGRMQHRPDLSDGVPEGWTSLGENVASGYRDGEDVVTGWMNSPGHRENILGDFTDIGVGWVVDGSGTSWSVQVFGSYPDSGTGAPQADVDAEPTAPESETTAPDSTTPRQSDVRESPFWWAWSSGPFSFRR